MSTLATYPTILDAEFEDVDLDGLCIKVGLRELVAEALGMPPMGHDEAIYSDEDEEILEQADAVLCALVARGVIRRADFTYDPDLRSFNRA